MAAKQARAAVRKRLGAQYMHSFKIELFEREHGVGSFPQFRSLNGAEACELCSRIRIRLGLPIATPAKELPAIIEARSRHLSQFDAEADAFSLGDVFAGESIESENLFIDWRIFDEIDELKNADLVEYFDDIWYPTADDIQVFDESISFIITVTHYGAVLILKFE